MIKYIEVREFKNDGYEYYHETFKEALESIKSHYESLTESEKRKLLDYLIIDCEESFERTFENEEELQEFSDECDFGLPYDTKWVFSEEFIKQTIEVEDKTRYEN